MKQQYFEARSLSRAAAAFLATVAVWTILSFGLASTLATSRPYAALAIYSGEREARLQLSRALEPEAEPGRFSGIGERETAQAKLAGAVAALNRAPLSAEAFRQIAIVAEHRGEQARAARLLAESFRRNFRDIDVSGRLFQQDIRDNKLVDAIRDADALLRSREELIPLVLPMLITLGELPETQAAVIRAVERRPPWRRSFLEELSKTPAGEPLYLKFQSELSGGPGALTPYETKNLLFALTARGHVDEALSVWLQSKPDLTLDRMPLLYNGKFDLPVNDSPFNWLVARSRAASLRIADLPGEPGRHGLNVEFAGQRDYFAAVEQTLALLPGRYRLTGRFMPDDFRNSRGLVWRIYCGPPHPSRLSETERLLPGPVAWQSFSLDFEIPASDCRSQYLRLELPARISAEMSATGGVWFSDLAINDLN